MEPPSRENMKDNEEEKVNSRGLCAWQAALALLNKEVSI